MADQHTQGNWALDSIERANGGEYHRILDADGKPVLALERPRGELRANFILCTASPRLLQACRAARDLILDEGRSSRQEDAVLSQLMDAIEEAQKVKP